MGILTRPDEGSAGHSRITFSTDRREHRQLQLAYVTGRKSQSLLIETVAPRIARPVEARESITKIENLCRTQRDRVIPGAGVILEENIAVGTYARGCGIVERVRLMQLVMRYFEPAEHAVVIGDILVDTDAAVVF